ncbi:MAG: response regulator [Bdellovibrionota bacterium]
MTTIKGTMVRSTNFLLIEDDDAHARIIMRSILECKSIKSQVTLIENGEKALNIIQNYTVHNSFTHPDYILLDLNLPKVNGMDILKMIKDHPFLYRTPVVILTSSDSRQEKLDAYRMHVNSYLIKPTEPGRFKQMVKDLLSYWSCWNKNVSSDLTYIEESS